jgi:Domain of unknown function (DUF4062)
MTDKRYQVFVSSTYVDLKDERQRVLKALLDMDCIPAGMEMFPASDEEQFEYIRRIIDASDYYILIIGGRYGTLTSEGISYTEKEYDYAIDRQKPICAFVHSRPGKIPSELTERDPTIAEKLSQFRTKVMESRIVKQWEVASDLPAAVLLSLTHAIKRFPQHGWVRGDTVSSIQLLTQINELRAENDRLKQSKTKEKSDNLEKLFNIEYTNSAYLNSHRPVEKYFTLREIVNAVDTPFLHGEINKGGLKEHLKERLFGFSESMDINISEKSFNEIFFVFEQLNYIKEYADTVFFTTKFRRLKLNVCYGIVDF